MKNCWHTAFVGKTPAPHHAPAKKHHVVPTKHHVVPTKHHGPAARGAAFRPMHHPLVKPHGRRATHGATPSIRGLTVLRDGAGFLVASAALVLGLVALAL